MRTLIDGYNVMFEAGLMGEKFGPDRFRKVRLRFLNDLASGLEPVEAHLTTVVFDANDSPGHLPSAIHHKGIAVLFAVDHDSADERIEDLIARHANPKTLTVVSSDHRIQRAATRRKARILSADEFLVSLDDRKQRKRPSLEANLLLARQETPSAEEAAFWLEEFRDVAESEEARQIHRGDPAFPTDEEIARIEREVDEEFRRR